MAELETYFRYWGKADPNYPGEPKWHPLVYHCLDVAACAKALLLKRDDLLEKQIGDIYTDLKTGSTPSRLVKDYFVGENLWITSGELNYSYINNTIEKVSDKAIKDTNLRLYPIGTFFIAITGLEAPGTRGKCAINALPATTNQSCLAFYEKDELDTKFLYYWYNKYGIPLYYRYAQGTKQQSFNNKIVEKFKISLPSKQEQEKIALFLTSVDTKIGQLSKKEELLSSYKKGVMQKIFSGEIRFKADDGSAFAPWEEKKLKDISSKKSSNISANTLEENTGNYKIYGATGHLKNIDFFTEDEAYISIVKDGAGVGRVLLCDAESSVLGTLDIIKNDKGVNLHFIYLLLTRIHFEKYVVGSTIPHIYYKDYSSEKIQVPCIEEQTKIANFLSSIDSKIEQVGKQLDESKQFKKALLQQMFV